MCVYVCFSVFVCMCVWFSLCVFLSVFNLFVLACVSLCRMCVCVFVCVCGFCVHLVMYGVWMGFVCEYFLL